nr:uncharacterized protein LOC127342190 [Lolium perenne]
MGRRSPCRSSLSINRATVHPYQTLTFHLLSSPPPLLSSSHPTPQSATITDVLDVARLSPVPVSRSSAPRRLRATGAPRVPPARLLRHQAEPHQLRRAHARRQQRTLTFSVADLTAARTSSTRPGSSRTLAAAQPRRLPEPSRALSGSPSPPPPRRAPQAFASSRIGSRSGAVRYDKFSGCSSASFNRYEDMFDEDDASEVTLPAWPGQGYGRHLVIFRTLSPICILSVLGRI